MHTSSRIAVADGAPEVVARKVFKIGPDLLIEEREQPSRSRVDHDLESRRAQRIVRVAVVGGGDRVLPGGQRCERQAR
jgi:hypothetical protein